MDRSLYKTRMTARNNLGEDGWWKKFEEDDRDYTVHINRIIEYIEYYVGYDQGLKRNAGDRNCYKPIIRPKTTEQNRREVLVFQVFSNVQSDSELRGIVLTQPPFSRYAHSRDPNSQCPGY